MKRAMVASCGVGLPEVRAPWGASTRRGARGAGLKSKRICVPGGRLNGGRHEAGEHNGGLATGKHLRCRKACGRFAYDRLSRAQRPPEYSRIDTEAGTRGD